MWKNIDLKIQAGYIQGGVAREREVFPVNP